MFITGAKKGKKRPGRMKGYTMKRGGEFVSKEKGEKPLHDSSGA